MAVRKIKFREDRTDGLSSGSYRHGETDGRSRSSHTAFFTAQKATSILNFAREAGVTVT